MLFTPRSSRDGYDGASSPRASFFGSPPPAMGTVRPTRAGPRESYNTKFSHRYAVNEVFPSRGRRHFSPGDRVNPLNCPSPTDMSNVPFSLPRALGGGRSRGPSASPPRSPGCSTPNLFEAPPGAWRSPRRSPCQSPRTSRSPSPSVTSRESQPNKHRTPHNSQRVRELLMDKSPLDGEVARSPAAPRSKRVDPLRNVSPGVSEKFLPSSEASLLRPLPSSGKLFDGTNCQSSAGVRGLLMGDANAALVRDQSPRGTILASRNCSISTRALVQAEYTQGEISHQNWQQEYKVSPRAKVLGTRIAHQSLAVPFATTEVTVATACPMPLADVARSCMQRVELREKADHLRLRESQKCLDMQPRAEPPPVRRLSANTKFFNGQSSRGSLGWESTTAGNSAGGSTCGSNSGDARVGTAKASAITAGPRSARTPSVPHVQAQMRPYRLRSSDPGALMTPSTAASTPGQAHVYALPPPLAEDQGIKAVEECTHQVADAVANLMARSKKA